MKQEVKKDFKERPHYVASATNKKFSPKTFTGSSSVSSSYSNKSGKEFKEKDLKDVECFKCHKKGHYANKCREIKSKESKGVFKVRNMEEQSEVKSDDKVVRQIRMRYSDFADRNSDPFLRYWVLCYDLGPIRDPTKKAILQGFLLILVLISTLSPGIFTICWFVKV